MIKDAYRVKRGTVVVCAVAALLAASAVAFAIRAPGSLDRSFGHDGKVVTGFRHRTGTPEYIFLARANAVATDARDRIVAVGTADQAFALARYLPSGRLDRSFSGNGRVKTNVSRRRNEAFGGVIDRRGRIVAAGWAIRKNFDVTTALVRYEPDGRIDRSFGKRGIVMTDLAGPSSRTAFSEAKAIAIDGRGRLVVAGVAENDFGLARYMPSGRLDRSFGTGGRVMTGFSADSRATSVAIDSRGRIVAGGYTRPPQDFALARYRRDGTLDASFGAGGRVTTDIDGRDSVNSVAIDAEDRIVAAGVSGQFSQHTLRFALARYLDDGSLDASFGQGGKVTTGFKGQSKATGVAIDQRHRIVATGWSGARRFAVARYLGDGRLDPAFSRNGRTTTKFGAGERQGANGVAIDSRHRIVAAGFAGGRFALARYHGGRD